jgi:uncharacterized protein
MKKQQNNGNSFLFAITHDCNFRCEYCYENIISANGESWSKVKFTKSLVDKAFNTMLEIQPDRSKQSNVIGLYGGEPLMAKNYDIVEYIVSMGINRNYTFKSITNGYDIDKYIELLGPKKINFLQISIDGLNDTHNKRRPHFQNNDSFSKICKNISLALNKDVHIGLRINSDANNFDEIEKLIHLFEQQKWMNNPLFHVSIANVQSHENCNEMQLHHLEKILKLKRENPFFRKIFTPENVVTGLINQVIKNDTFLMPKATYCGAHNGMYIFDPYGDIYTCWDKFGMKNHVVGNFKNGLYFDENILRVWRGRNIISISKCRKCRYALICAGGCAGTLEQQRESLDIYKPHCANFPVIFAKAINELSNYINL